MVDPAGGKNETPKEPVWAVATGDHAVAAVCTMNANTEGKTDAVNTKTEVGFYDTDTEFAHPVRRVTTGKAGNVPTTAACAGFVAATPAAVEYVEEGGSAVVWIIVGVLAVGAAAGGFWWYKKRGASEEGGQTQYSSLI